IMFLRIEPIRSKDISQEKLLKMHSHFAKEVADFTRKYEGTLERISIGRYIISFRDDPAIALKLAVDLRMQVRSWGKTMNEYILFRCGIHYGSAVWGLYGSTEIWSGGYIGDAVNIAARLEMLCGRYHSAILMSQDSFFQSAHMDNYVVRMLEPVKLKGKEDHVFVYEVLSGLPDDLLDSYIQARNEFGQGLQAFLSKDLQIAVYIFQHVLEINPNDYAAKLYLERTMNILNKGEDKEWNPIESLSTK
ncbi:MAG: adenylate/guanylate cyclase domain-containing protein, partial [Leptospira sp.]|nr:adenylate/guanylate cyclase domain-containing protein [Leptospira sp.]